jgi:hypothetical protein
VRSSCRERPIPCRDGSHIVGASFPIRSGSFWYSLPLDHLVALILSKADECQPGSSSQAVQCSLSKREKMCPRVLNLLDEKFRQAMRPVQMESYSRAQRILGVSRLRMEESKDHCHLNHRQAFGCSQAIDFRPREHARDQVPPNLLPADR